MKKLIKFPSKYLDCSSQNCGSWTAVFDAARLLEKFVEAGIEFQIEQFDIPEPARSEYMAAGCSLRKQIDVYVHLDEKEEAMEILAADWKV